MTGHPLRHVAIIADTIPPASGEPDDVVLATLRKAAEIARAAFGTIPALQAFSFLAPGLDPHCASGGAAVSVPESWIEGGREIRAAAADVDAAVRLCGRVSELPDALRSSAATTNSPRASRTLLWYLRYGGRDEIARAAGRFLSANPGTRLGDDELEAWLDTAGVPDPDLIILAGGRLEARDALVWQGSYAEIWHTPVPWVRFTAVDLSRALGDFSERQRRFGR